jgi:hypothetical protein
MKFASILSAKLLILLFTGIAATSAFYGKKIYQEIPVIKGKLLKAEKTIAGLEKDGQTLQANLTQDATPVPLNTALSNAILSVMDNRIRYGIYVGNIAPHKSGAGNAGMADFSQLSEKVPGSSVQSVRMNIRGTYRSLAGLTGYLAELRKQPAAIVYLKVNGDAFDLGLRVYGSK